MASSESVGPLLPHGFLPAGVVLPAHVVPKLLAEAKTRTYNGVFNRVGGGDDEYRWQSRVADKAMSDSVLALKTGLQVLVAMIHPGWVPNTFSFMRFDPGGIDQEPHQDYTTSDIERFQAVHPGGVPGSMIFALQAGTRLHVFEGCFDARDENKATIVTVPTGFCVLFRGDLIHSSVAYEETNYRIHCYLTYEGVQWVPDIVQSTLGPHSTCKYCGIKMDRGPKFHKHQFYCEQNPKDPDNRLKRKFEGMSGVYKCVVCANVCYRSASSLRVHNMRKHPKE
ncbi:hypothetical protein PI124_g21746 [Phytophthora idaei]|nr:hypothetical protein PI124_g21746 [Phytophthora idaei]